MRKEIKYKTNLNKLKTAKRTKLEGRLKGNEEIRDENPGMGKRGKRGMSEY